MKNFIAKYGKWVAVAIVVITFGLLAIPGYFKLGAGTYSGYEMIFRASYTTKDFNYLAKNYPNAKVCVIGIIALVCTLLSGVSFVFDKNSSALDIFGGILMLISAVIFLAMQGWAIICYRRTEECTIGAIAYVIGALQLLVGAVMTYIGFTLLKEEKKNPKAVGYSYIKKNK